MQHIPALHALLDYISLTTFASVVARTLHKQSTVYVRPAAIIKPVSNAKAKVVAQPSATVHLAGQDTTNSKKGAIRVVWDHLTDSTVAASAVLLVAVPASTTLSAILANRITRRRRTCVYCALTAV